MKHALTLQKFGIPLTLGQWVSIVICISSLIHCCWLDVFENFRKTCLQYYKLDPCHYFTSPGLSWDAMLKTTQVQLELMTDISMLQFIEKGMRGSISYIANRHGEANNKYMTGYDSDKPSKYIMYVDDNNLYGFTMSQCLPAGGFKAHYPWRTSRVISFSIISFSLRMPNNLFATTFPLV